MRADLEKLAQLIRPVTEDESRAAGLAEADAGLVEQRRNRLRRIADEMGDLSAREALWHYARAVSEMHWEMEKSEQVSVERRWLAENGDALESSNAFVEERGLPLHEHQDDEALVLDSIRSMTRDELDALIAEGEASGMTAMMRDMARCAQEYLDAKKNE